MKEMFNKLFSNNIATFDEIMKMNLKKDNKMFIVTANPETFMIGEEDSEMKELLLDKNTTIVPDGIGIVKASKKFGLNIKERITGIDIAEKLLEYGDELNKKIYLFGAKEDVINLMKEKINSKYPNLIIVGSSNGYVIDKDSIFDEISKLEPDIILVALGIPLQEKLIYKHLKKFKKGIFVGVGGSFDVISGYKKRAPNIFIKINLEWLYRLIKEPKRIKRFYNNNIRFMFKVKKFK